jgi:exodeoxyribonuclease VII large subunit
LNRQLDLSPAPQRIAVISSKEAAGLQDFLQHLHNNPHRFAFNTELFQAAMQGVNLSHEVVMQIESIEAQAKDFDCIVIVRGGGAKLDLMGFDDFEVCKAIATCELPVLTGIGHDVDETLSDLVAHSSMKTPTAVADFLVQSLLNFESELNRTAIELQQIVQKRLMNETLKLDNLFNRFNFAISSAIRFEQRNLDILENKLELLLPEHTLKRGFAMIYDESGMPLRSISEISENQQLILKLSDGEIVVRVERI